MKSILRSRKYPNNHTKGRQSPYTSGWYKDSFGVLYSLRTLSTILIPKVDTTSTRAKINKSFTNAK